MFVLTSFKTLTQEQKLNPKTIKCSVKILKPEFFKKAYFNILFDIGIIKALIIYNNASTI